MVSLPELNTLAVISTFVNPQPLIGASTLKTVMSCVGGVNSSAPMSGVVA